MEVRVLGAVEVQQDHQRVALPGAACRAVLTLLALDAGRVVLLDDIIDGLWDVERPQDPAGAVHITISRLRNALGDGRGVIRRDRVGYVLDDAAATVDVARAENALRAGRAALAAGDTDRAARLLDGGLREWRGQPLVEFADLPFAAPAASRLHLLRLALLEARNAALLDAGRPAEVIDDSVGLLDADPWREELASQLMLALYRTGRQVDALAVYAQVSSALQRDFSVSPSPTLQTLHTRIVAHDPDLAGRRADEHGERLAAVGAAALPRWFEAALHANDAADDVVRARLLLALGEAQHYAGEPGWHTTLHDAGKAASAAGDAETVARAALAGALGWGVRAGTADAARLELIDDALAHRAVLGPGTTARLLAARASELAYTATLDERAAASDEAVRLARQSGEPATLLAVLTQRYNALWAPDTLAERTRDLEEAAQLAVATAHPVAEATVSGWQMAAAIERGDLAATDAHLAAFVALGERLEMPVLHWGAVLHSAWRAVVAGDLVRAEALCDEAQRVGEHAHRPEAPLVGAMQLVGIRWAQNRLPEAVDAVTAVRAALPDLGALRAFDALARFHAGATAAASSELRSACVERAVAALPRNPMYLAALVQWAELAYHLADREAASLLLAQLTPFNEQFVFTGTAVYGPVAHTAGLLALAIGDRDAAVHHLAAARRLAAAMPAPLFVARTDAVAARHHLTLPT